MAIATNQEYILAYNEYLKTHNLTETKDVFTKIDGVQYGVQSDMFFNYLCGMIGYTTVGDITYSNPLNDLYDGDMFYGKYEREIIPVPKSRVDGYGVADFKTDVTNPFTKNKTNLSVCYHQVNDHKIVKITTSYDQIKEAFDSDYGVNSLVQAIIKLIDTQLNAWAYYRMRNVIEDINWGTVEYVRNFEEFSVLLKNLNFSMSDFDESAEYNTSAINNPTNPDKIIAVVSGKYRNEADVKYFTGLYNQAMADWKGNIKYISSFNNPNIIAKVFDRRGIKFKKTLDRREILRNPEDLTYNHYSHQWRMHSVSPHYAAVTIILVPENAAIATSSLKSGIYKGSQSITINTNGGTNVKYKVNNGSWISVNGADPINVNINTSSTVYVQSDSEDVNNPYIKAYHYRII